MSTFPSIFNDVIGPVMRGPSSSHCAASLRIGRLCRDLMNGKISEALIEFDPNGSLATTHRDQGSDMGLFGGFLGWEADDERLPDSEAHLAAAGIKTEIRIVDIGADHPNTYKFTLKNDSETRTLTAISTGGGMIEVIEIDGAEVSFAGDRFLTIIECDDLETLASSLSRIGWDVSVRRGSWIEVSSLTTVSDESAAFSGVRSVRELRPVLPVLTRRGVSVPFTTCAEMLAFNAGRDLELWELACEYESARAGIDGAEVFEKMRAIVRIMENAVRIGLAGTKYADRILPSQSPQYRRKFESGALIGGDVNNTVVMYVSATMEVKSSMGVIVAAPTAGSCGALPGAILGTAHCLGVSEDETVKAMLGAGLIGVFIAAHATFAAEVGGCMAETGSGGGMAAAGLVALGGGSLTQSLGAASLALQNSLGLICDPIGNRVEAPCLGRNVMAANNAVACANMALADFESLIPLDEVIETMKAVGDRIHHTLRCTNLGGLSITRSAKEIESGLNQKAVFKVC
jgi:L-serine dehydratase